MFNGARYKVKDEIVESIVTTKQSAFPVNKDNEVVVEDNTFLLKTSPLVVFKEEGSIKKELIAILSKYKQQSILSKVITFPKLLLKVISELIKIYKTL